jgi:molecular chaperone Hsp33
MDSYLIRGTAAQDTLRVIAADTTRIVEEARQRHQTSPTATAALGRSLTASLLLAQVLSKTDDARLTIRIQGDGPVGWIVTEGSRDGQTRGYVKHAGADVPARADGKLDVGGLVGTDGEIAVTRLLENAEPYTGSVPLVSGEIGEDVATYLMRSEQIPSVTMLGVFVNDRGVSHAGGLIVQTVPGVTEATLAALEENVRQMGQFTNVLRQEGLLGAVERITKGLDYAMNEDSLSLKFQCRCSMDRAVQALTYFGPDERQEMIESGGQEVVCHWCNEKHFVTPELIRSLEADSSGADAQG